MDFVKAKGDIKTAILGQLLQNVIAFIVFFSCYFSTEFRLHFVCSKKCNVRLAGLALLFFFLIPLTSSRVCRSF